MMLVFSTVVFIHQQVFLPFLILPDDRIPGLYLLRPSHHLNRALNAALYRNQAIITIYVDSKFQKLKLIRRDFIARGHSAVLYAAPIISASSFRYVKCVRILPTIPPGASPPIVD